MGFRQTKDGHPAMARIWKLTEDYGKYCTVQLSTSKKNKDSGEYETDFQDGFVRLVGQAYNKFKQLTIPEKGGLGVVITSCEVTTYYSANTKKNYVNYTVFGMDSYDEWKNGESPESESTSSETPNTTTTDGEDLPF